MANILIADAGSSKIDWCLINSELKYFESEGWNPSQDQTGLTIATDIEATMKLADELYFYGTGIGTDHARNLVKEKLTSITAAKLHIESDLLAAAKALFGDEHGIVVILGTGSSVCYYDRGTISYATPSLGYFLSDEGSGNAIGKRIVRDFMYHRMPAEIKRKFKEEFELTKTMLLDALYQQPKPNVYLSQFTKFLRSVDGAWKENVLQEAFEQLVSHKILAHKNFLSVPVGFVGSIAQNFNEQLEKSCRNYDIEDIKIIGSPIEPLAEYHKAKLHA